MPDQKHIDTSHNPCIDKNCHEEGRLCIPESNHPRIVIVGGGFAGLNLIKQLKNRPVQIVLIDKNNFHQFLPLLYQVAVCGIEPDNIVFPYRKLFKKYHNVIFRMAEVAGIISDRNELFTSIGSIHYDYLVIASGIKPNYFGNNNFRDLGLGLNSVTDALDIRSKLLQNLERAASTCIIGEKESLCNIAIVGRGPAGVEMAGALAEFRRYILPKDYPELRDIPMNIYLLEGGKRVMPWLPDKLSEKTHKYLTDLGVNILLNNTVSNYDGRKISLNHNESLYASLFIWTAGVKAVQIKGLPTDIVTKQNRIMVDSYNRVQSLTNVFALGNIAWMKTDEYPYGHPMVAQVAIQQGKTLAKNLRKLLANQTMKPFIYHDKGAMVTIGKKKAVARIGSWNFSGFFAWLIWSGVHLLGIVGAKNRILVAIDWLWSYFTYDKGNRVIIRKYKSEINSNTKKI
jgi:NADH dehydrogenase